MKTSMISSETNGDTTLAEAATTSGAELKVARPTFLSECCERGPALVSVSADLYRAYMEWSETHACAPVGRHKFALILRKLGCSPHRTATARYWTGIRLNGHANPPFRTSTVAPARVRTGPDGETYFG